MRGEAGRGPDRRRVLRALGTSVLVAGLAGCSSGGDGGDGASETPAGSGDGGDGGGGGDSGSDGDGGGGDGAGRDGNTGGGQTVSCDGLTEATYTRYDEADSPFVGTFEHPGSVAATGTVNNVHSLTVRLYVGDRQAFDVFPTQSLEGTDSPTDAQRGNVDGLEQVGEFDFGGETVPLVRASPAPNGDNGTNYYRNYPYYVAGLPHDSGGSTTYYRMSVKGSVQFAEGLEPTVCGDAFEEVARRVLRSLEPNPDTTVADAGV